MSFKIGDLVRRNDNAGTSGPCSPGCHYTVNYVSDDGDYIGVEADCGEPQSNHIAVLFTLVYGAKGHASDGGGLQNHSIGGPFPFVLVGIDNPTGLEPGLYWYVQDKTGKRCSVHSRSCDKAATYAANLVRLLPKGIGPDTPPLKLSEGYIKPKPATVTLPYEVAEKLDEFFKSGGGRWASEVVEFKAAFAAVK